MGAQKKKKEAPVPSLPAASAAVLDHHILAAARTRIDAAAAVLTGFHLRHKNQHRVSTYWWPALGQLRRHARRLRNDLEMADKAANSATRTTLEKRAPKGGLRGDRHPVALVLARARWLRLHWVPKAYVAFSRLVADRQFAPLGLLLMGVLAQVNAVLRGLDAAAGGSATVGENGSTETGEASPMPGGDNRSSDESESGEDDDSASLRLAKARGTDGRDANKAYGATEPAVDFGVAVPREEEEESIGPGGGLAAGSQSPGVSDNTTRPATKRPGPEADAGEAVGRCLPPTPAGVDAVSSKRRKGERPGTDTDVVAEKPAETASDVLLEKSEKKERKEKKAKVKKRKRDEFDDLFSGLL